MYLCQFIIVDSIRKKDNCVGIGVDSAIIFMDDEMDNILPKPNTDGIFQMISSFKAGSAARII